MPIVQGLCMCIVHKFVLFSLTFCSKFCVMFWTEQVIRLH